MEDIKELQTKYDGANSFYKKAYIVTKGKTIYLKSYETIVAYIKNNKAVVNGYLFEKLKRGL